MSRIQLCLINNEMTWNSHFSESFCFETGSVLDHNHCLVSHLTPNKQGQISSWFLFSATTWRSTWPTCRDATARARTAPASGVLWTGEGLPCRSAWTSRAAGARGERLPGCTATGPQKAPGTPGWTRGCGRQTEAEVLQFEPWRRSLFDEGLHVGVLPAVGVVQVGEEQHSTAEEREQHEDPVDFVQESVLLLILATWELSQAEWM